MEEQMHRMSYKTALRAKGIKPIPPYEKLRTRKSEGDHIVGATNAAN